MNARRVAKEHEAITRGLNRNFPSVPPTGSNAEAKQVTYFNFKLTGYDYIDHNLSKITMCCVLLQICLLTMFVLLCVTGNALEEIHCMGKDEPNTD
jgi:hypothetical protein